MGTAGKYGFWNQADWVPISFLGFIFQLWLTYNIILVSGVQHSDQIFTYPVKSSRLGFSRDIFP